MSPHPVKLSELIIWPKVKQIIHISVQRLMNVAHIVCIP